MSLEILGDSVGVGLEGILLISAEGDADNFVLAHQEFGVSEGLPEILEVIGAHVFEGENVEILVFGHEVVNLIHDELLVLSHLGLHLGQRNNFISFGFRHQQL